MKIYFDTLIVYLIFDQCISYCDAGLLDLLIRGRRRFFDVNDNINNNQNINNRMTRVVQNNPATIDRYNAGNNWRLPATILKSREDGINNRFFNDDPTNNNNLPDNQLPNNIRTPFTNGNTFNGHTLGNVFVSNDQNLNKANNQNTPLVNTPITNTNSYQNNANITKIMNDINKINTIMDAIKKQNSDNHRNSAGNLQISNVYPNNNYSPIGTGGLPLVHINHGQGVLTNNNGFQNNAQNQVSSPYISNEPHYNVPSKVPNTSNYNTAVTNPIISNVPTDKPMTNVPPSESVNNGLGNNNYNVNTNQPKPIISHPNGNGHETAPSDGPKESESHSINENNIKKDEKNDQYLLKPITKGKFFFQVEPVVPDYKIVSHNKTVYYVN